MLFNSHGGQRRRIQYNRSYGRMCADLIQMKKTCCIRNGKANEIEKCEETVFTEERSREERKKIVYSLFVSAYNGVKTTKLHALRREIPGRR